MKAGRKEIHGHCSRNRKRSPEWTAWNHMKRRCTNPNYHNYKNYGGRGITICERWLNSFENFLADMGNKPTPSHSLDRYPNNNGDYEPENCRWATPKEQSNNTKSNRIINHGGKSLTLTNWATELKLSISNLRYRIDTWGEARAIATKKRKYNRTF